MGGELFTLFAKLTLDTSEFDQKTDESKEKASVFGDVLKADLVGKSISAAIDGLKKLGSAAKDFTTSAVSAYGDVEQLRGGIETLFGDSAQKVLADADEAFKTAGMSAADYMDTSIQSAASLINSLGGDQAKAAELMNMSITDMADNVNKMGTSMEAVQNAYRGFSRGNFTMLDNLALGFSGTKEGMQDLLDKAEEISGIEYDISSYSDIVEAIHVVQDEMGITGTTSREASETLQGSIGAMKSAWDNFVAGIADPNANFGKLIDNLVDTSTTALDNIVPAIGRTLSGVGVMVRKMAPIVLDKIPELFNDIAPDLGEAALALLEYVGDAVTENAGTLLEAGMAWVEQLSTGVQEGLPEFTENFLDGVTDALSSLSDGSDSLLETGASFLESLAQGIMDSFPVLMEKLPELLQQVTDWITGSATMLVDTGVSIMEQFGNGLATGIPTLLQNILPLVLQMSESIRSNAGKLVDAGIDLILNLAQGLMNSLPTLLAQLPQIVINIAGVINDNAPKLLVAGVQLLITIGKGLIEAIPAFIENIPEIFKAFIAVWSALNWVNLGKSVITFIKNGFNALRTNLPSTLKSIGQSAKEWFTGIDWANAGSEIIGFIESAIRGLFDTIPGVLLEIGNSAWEAFSGVDWVALGSNIIDGIVSGLSSGIGWLKEKAAEAANSALQKAKDILGIKSPSRVFRDQVGKQIPRGMALGIEDTQFEVDKAIDRLNTDMLAGINRDIDYSPRFDFVSKGAKATEGKVVNVTINSTVDGAQKPEEYAYALIQALQQELRTT